MMLPSPRLSPGPLTGGIWQRATGRQPAVRASEVSISLRSPVTSHVRSRAPRAG